MGKSRRQAKDKVIFGKGLFHAVFTFGIYP